MKRCKKDEILPQVGNDKTTNIQEYTCEVN